MTDLSPQAQAVLDAYSNASDGEYVEGVWVVYERTMLAVALRAAALYCKRDRRILLTIADELDGKND